jgi:hypothetical protein
MPSFTWTHWCRPDVREDGVPAGVNHRSFCGLELAVSEFSLEFYPAVAETMTEAGARDERFGADQVSRAARLELSPRGWN